MSLSPIINEDKKAVLLYVTPRWPQRQNAKYIQNENSVVAKNDIPPPKPPPLSLQIGVNLVLIK